MMYVGKKVLQSKKTKKAIGVVVGVGALGTTAYLIYKYLEKKKEEEYVPTPAEEEFVIPEVPITLENILLIIQDVTLTQMEKIAILEAMYNEQFISMEANQTEILQIEEELEYVNTQIAQVETELVPYEQQVDSELSKLTSAQTVESKAYNNYITQHNKLNKLLNELAQAHKGLADCGFLDVFCALYWADQIMIRQGKVDKQEAITSNYWSIYLDKEQLRKAAESDYNSAILALELFKEENLFALQEEKIVLTNSLTMWKIAYQAATNILNELTKQLGILKGDGEEAENNDTTGEIGGEK